MARSLAELESRLASLERRAKERDCGGLCRALMRGIRTSKIIEHV